MGNKKGYIPWNKGLRNVQVSSRKGKTKETDSVLKRISEKLIGHAKFGNCGKYERTPEIRLKNSLSRKGLTTGDKNPNWHGGMSFYHGEDWNRIKMEIFKRDNFKCQLCGSNKIIQVHHIVPYRICQDHKEENLITLCQFHHRKVENHLRRKEFQDIVRTANINKIAELGRNILVLYKVK